MTARFKAILFDAGGVLVLPDPTVLGPLLAYYGGDPSVEAHRRAHYAGMAAKSAAGSGETFWDEYNHSYVRSIGVADARRRCRGDRRCITPATPTCGGGRSPRAVGAAMRWQTAGVPLGVVSNASGQIEEVLSRSGVCQVGDGPHVSMRVIVDSHVVGVAKPDPRIFDFALGHFDGAERHEIAYVGDSVTMDIGAAPRRGPASDPARPVRRSSRRRLRSPSQPLGIDCSTTRGLTAPTPWSDRQTTSVESALVVRLLGSPRLPESTPFVVPRKVD